MRYATASILCTLVSYPTLVFMVTIFILPPLGFYFGVKAYAQGRREDRHRRTRDRLLSAFPMLFAGASFLLQLYMVNHLYQA
jgi:Zn-dependent protease with chaperone function